VARIGSDAEDAAAGNGTSVDLDVESVTPLLDFDVPLRDRIATTVSAYQDGSDVPVLPTAAGHDAGILAVAGVRTAMLFVRNPTGISHSPIEHAEVDDCHAGVDALAAVVTELA
jgi:N-carbamoyl-L-amino-acid hydrolase